MPAFNRYREVRLIDKVDERSFPKNARRSFPATRRRDETALARGAALSRRVEWFMNPTVLAMKRPITTLMLVVALISGGVLAYTGCGWTSSPR